MEIATKAVSEWLLIFYFEDLKSILSNSREEDPRYS